MKKIIVTGLAVLIMVVGAFPALTQVGGITAAQAQTSVQDAYDNDRGKKKCKKGKRGPGDGGKCKNKGKKGGDGRGGKGDGGPRKQ